MKPMVRAAVAAIAVGHSERRPVDHVYSFHERMGFDVSVKVDGNVIVSRDLANDCGIVGTLPILYHNGLDAQIDLNYGGAGAYSGYDHYTSSHFTLLVSQSVVLLYDFNVGDHFRYAA